MAVIYVLSAFSHDNRDIFEQADPHKVNDSPEPTLFSH